jgi:UDPglucose--hexose-1-phosphate uridylyltransferase
VRVFPNLYPAFERQEVVVHAPEHLTSFADLSRDQVRAVAQAWRERAAAARADGFGYLHALVNEGRAAGASREHTHSQLVWLREPPPAVVAERVDGLAGILARDELRVADGGGVVAACHPAPRLPYELVIAPASPEADGLESERLPAALALLADVVARLRRLEGDLAWNAWLHTGDWWHVELVTRLSVWAGIELGAGIYVGTRRPEEAAAALRG